MRLQIEITDMTDGEWKYAQEVIRAEYQIPAGASRVCLTMTHGDEERHVEMPLASFVGVSTGLILAGAFRAFSEALSSDKISAALEKARNEADPQRAAERRKLILPTPDMVRSLSAQEAAELTDLINRPCDHQSPVVSVEPSQFPEAPPVRTHEDGCQSYGPYTDQKTYDPDFADRLENGAYDK